MSNTNWETGTTMIDETAMKAATSRERGVYVPQTRFLIFLGFQTKPIMSPLESVTKRKRDEWWKKSKIPEVFSVTFHLQPNFVDRMGTFKAGEPLKIRLNLTLTVSHSEIVSGSG